MKNRKTTLFTVFLLLLSIPQVVNANSSWVWISETRPYDVLPVVAAATIIIEVWMINRYTGMKKPYRTMAYVVAANLVSFLCPYVVNYCQLVDVKGYQSMSEMFAHWPAYTVGMWFLIMTMALEVPIVYFGLKEKVDEPRKLKKVIILVNVLTTIMVAVVERTVCQGHW